jgi:hypothetical protein
LGKALTQAKKSEAAPAVQNKKAVALKEKQRKPNVLETVR